MDYSSYKEMALTIGGADIESGIKKIINKRFKGTEKH